MPRKRKTLDERIGHLSGKKSDINKQIETLRSKRNGERRKLNTHRQIVGGGIVFSEASADPDFAKILYPRFQRRLAARDRGLFTELMEQWRGSSAGVAGPATAPVRPERILEDTGRNLSHKR
jgi:hypothetical protein